MAILTLFAQAIMGVFVARAPAPKPPRHHNYFRVYSTPMSEYALHVYTNGKLFDFHDSGELDEWLETQSPNL